MMGKARSFEEKREVLRQEMTAEASGNVVSKKITFSNSDVASFLANLDEFEATSLQNPTDFK